MQNLMTPGVMLGLLAIGGTVCSTYGYPVLGAFLSDPQTAATASAVANGILILGAGLARGVTGGTRAKVAA